MKIGTIGKVLAAATAVFALSCDSASVSGVPGAADLARSRPGAVQSLFDPKPLVCPTSESAATTADVGPLGGLVSAGGTSVSIPAGALLETVTLTVTVPASNYVEIDVSVAGAESFIFELPVVVTVSYDRCTRTNIDFSPISAWHFDQGTGELLQQMPSVDNKLLRTVTFTTGHLSGYILAN